MADGVSFDFSELNKLAADLGEVPKNAGPLIRSAVQFTATNVKKDAAASVGGLGPYWSVAAGSIDYDIKGSASSEGSSIEVEVGYNKGKGAGPLGNLIEFGAPGAPNHAVGPHNDLANALEKNQDDFEKGLGKALGDAMGKAGL